MHLSRIKVARGGAIAALLLAAAIWVGIPLRPAVSEERLSLAELTRTSVIITSVVIPLTAVRDKMEKVLPDALIVKRDNPPVQVPAIAETDWNIVRGPLSVSGLSDDGLAASAALNGTFRTAGQTAGRNGGASDLLQGERKQGAQNPTEVVPDLRADFRGELKVTFRPVLLPNWRIEPHLAAQVTISKASLVILGNDIDVSNETKPLLDRAIQEQIVALETQVRNDSLLENAARREWAKVCRAIPLDAAAAGMPKLWLEVRPIRAMGAQPRIDESSLVLTIGVQAETRIVPDETKPECPFPDQIQLVPQLERGQVHIALPIDAPFEEVSRLLEAQLKGRTFPEGKGNSVVATIQSVRVTPARDRLLISLGIRARERKTWFGLSAAAVVHARGRPVLDSGRQVLRFDDITLKVESQGAFGLLGAAARAATPYLENALAEHALIDLKPIAATARKRFAEVVAASRGTIDGMDVDAVITHVRLLGVAFDAKTLRVQAEVDGLVLIKVTELP
jgi:hypothetical protein